MSQKVPQCPEGGQPSHLSHSGDGHCGALAFGLDGEDQGTAECLSCCAWSSSDLIMLGTLGQKEVLSPGSHRPHPESQGQLRTGYGSLLPCITPVPFPFLLLPFLTRSQTPFTHSTPSPGLWRLELPGLSQHNETWVLVLLALPEAPLPCLCGTDSKGNRGFPLLKSSPKKAALGSLPVLHG